MRIAIMGCRGIPARYGGFETLAEELSARLVARGHVVTVYCRWRYQQGISDVTGGVKRVVLPALYTKHAETLSHTFFSVLHQATCPPGVVLLLNNANAIFIPLLKLSRKRVFVHVDGLEWQRKKWGFLAKAWHRLSERLAVRWADGLISDSHFIQEYYLKTYRRKPFYAPYGCHESSATEVGSLQKYGLVPGEYLLFVGRLEPENNPAMILEAYAEAKRGNWGHDPNLRNQIGSCPRISGYVPEFLGSCPQFPPLVMVGWAPHAKSYVRRLHAGADPDVRFLGGVYGDDYKLLLHHCRAFIHASSVGGTHPVLVEAMGAGRPVLLSDIPENRETAGDAALWFGLAQGDLAEKIRWVLCNPGHAGEIGKRARERAVKLFRWDTVASDYETILAGQT